MSCFRTPVAQAHDELLFLVFDVSLPLNLSVSRGSRECLASSSSSSSSFEKAISTQVYPNDIDAFMNFFPPT